MKAVHSALVVLAMAPWSVAHAQQCAQPRSGFGAFLDSLTSVFEQSSAKFEYSRNGVSYQGSVKVKEATCHSTTVSVRLQAARQETEKGAKGKVDAKAGAAVEFEMTLPNAVWSNGTPPNPFDPTTLPPGGSMIFRQEAFVALGLEGQWKALVASAGVELGTGAVVAVRRLPDGRVQLLVGPYEVVRAEMSIGAGVGNVRVGVGRDDKMEHGNVRQWTFDPSNEDDMTAFRWALGQGAALGAVPFTSRPSDRVSYISYESAAGLRVKVGPFKFGGNWGQSMGDVRVVTRPDGSRTYEGMFNFRGTVLRVRREFDPQGNAIGGDKLTVTYSRVNAWTAYALRAALGAEKLGSNEFMKKGSATEDVQIEVGPDDWQQWRDRARAYLEHWKKNAIGMPPPLVSRLAEAKSADDVAMALYYATGTGRFTRFADDLLHMTMAGEPRGTNRPLPGTVTNPCPGNTGAGSMASANAEQRARDLAQRWCGVNAGRYTPTHGGVHEAQHAIGAGIARD